MNRILCGDALTVLRRLKPESVHCCVTSPPYWGLRDYGVAGQLGLERTPEEYVSRMVEIFREVRRVLKTQGTLWLNLGDSYATGAGKVGNCPGGGAQGERWSGGRGMNTKNPKWAAALGPIAQPNRMPIIGLKPKDMVGIPWRVAFALQADGWYLRSDIIWHKPNPMPESVRDRPTKAHEYLFLLAKSQRYVYDADAIRENASDWGPRDRSKAKHNTAGFRVSGQPPHHGLSDGDWADIGRNRRSVWTITTRPFKGAHFATFPEKLIEPCILAGCPRGGTVLDPFFGAGTTGVTAKRLSRNCVGIELNPAYVEMARLRQAA